MKRRAKDLQKKAKAHDVQPAGNGQFWVTSASSGNRYLVTDLANGSLQCTCEWAKYHPKRDCSHTLAVEEWLEWAANRRLSFWATPEDAQRQRQPTRWLSQGLWATSRVSR